MYITACAHACAVLSMHVYFPFIKHKACAYAGQHLQWHNAKTHPTTDRVWLGQDMTLEICLRSLNHNQCFNPSAFFNLTQFNSSGNKMQTMVKPSVQRD